MGAKDPRIDKYIADAPEFARPILTRFRGAVHAACPEVTETIKWSSPFFMRKKILCSMAAFKAHCRVIFWTGGDPSKLGHERITSADQLGSDKELRALIEAGVKLDEAGVKSPRKASSAARLELKTPPDLEAALRKNKKAAETFKNFSPSHRREYIDWINGAKKEETRTRRLAQTLSQLAEGKPRHWKYQNC